MYPPKVEGDSEVVTAFFPLAEPLLLDDQAIVDGVINLMLPRATCAVLTHSGSYSSMGDTYRKLGAWVATNATIADQPVRELYVVSTDEAGVLLPDSELRTEIAWPIADSAPSHSSPNLQGVSMSLVHKAVTFDCIDATLVSGFWSAVLGPPLDTEPMPPSPFFASIGLGDSSRIAYMFIQVPEGKTVKNRVHLDLDSDEVAADVARVISLGATHIHDKNEFGMHWTTLADPEGNEFCIGTPHD